MYNQIRNLKIHSLIKKQDMKKINHKKQHSNLINSNKYTNLRKKVNDLQMKTTKDPETKMIL